MKFVQFGCWNEYTCNVDQPDTNPVSMVMNKLNQMKDIDFIIVSGDNYYPDKDVVKIKPGQIYEGVMVEAELRIKKKKINRSDIVAGFNCLPKSVEVNIILGNHDLETQKKQIYKLDNGEYEPDGACTILNTETSISETNNFNFNYYISKYDEATKTLVIMLDTSMYSTDDVSELLSCYKYLIPRDEHMTDDEYIEAIRKVQYDKIVADLTLHKGEIKNLIMSGHHPISGYKLKLSDKKNNFVVLGDDLEPFMSVLTNIYTIAGESAVNYYYLCADLHLYQQGKVVLDVDDTHKMIINQFIVGTGGTTLDPNPFSPEHADVKKNRLNVVDTPILGDKHRYIMSDDDMAVSNANYGYGFLLCEMSGDAPNFSFIMVNKMSGGKKRRTTKKRKRTTKRKRRTAKKH
jgi:hypothetical protein